MTKKQKWSVIVFLATVWAFSIIAPAFIKGYKPPPEIHSGFPMIIGAMLAYPSRAGDEDEDDSEEVEPRSRRRRSIEDGGDEL